MINTYDNQWCYVLPFITNTRAEKGKNSFRKQTPSEGVHMRLVLHIEK